MKKTINKEETKNVKKAKEPIVTETITPKNTKKKLYFSFSFRLILNIVLFLLLLISGTILLNNSLKFENEQFVKYNEKSNLDYRVYLLKNDFYEQEYLGKDMLYVASLIDKIRLDFNYQFETEDNENLDFDYSIIGKLSITNPEGTRSYFEKMYTLLDKKQTNMKDTNLQTITETLDIDYGYYNSLANSFKSSYGVEAESKLTVYMVINKKNNEASNFKLDNNSIINIIIPLSQRAIDIKLDYQEVNQSSEIVKKQDVTVRNTIYLAIAITLIVVSLAVMIKSMRLLNLLRNKKSEYDKYINKILKEYDRLVAETTTLISFKDKEIIKVNKFTELLDLHDNLQLPIMYYSVTAHQKAYFYINHNNTIYLMTIKATDLEGNKNKI